MLLSKATYKLGQILVKKWMCIYYWFNKKGKDIKKIVE